MGANIEELRVQHKSACDKIVQRLESKSSRGEGPSRVLRKILKHFDKSNGSLLLTADEFVQAMERVGTKLSPSDLDLLLTVYGVDGSGFDGERFTADLFGEGGYSSSMIVESNIAGGVFSADNTPRTQQKQRMNANVPSIPGGPLMQQQAPPDSSRDRRPSPQSYREPSPQSYREPAPQSYREPAQNSYLEPAQNSYRDPRSDAPQQKMRSNDSSIPGGIFGSMPESEARSKRVSKNNQSSIPGGIFG